jgi:hypothetical protein
MNGTEKRKIQFSEVEAAISLGVTRSQLRRLVSRIVDGEARLDGDVFQASDLVLLRFLGTNVPVQ